MTGQFWVEGTDEGGEPYSVRWANATDEQADAILKFAEGVLGRVDTVG